MSHEVDLRSINSTAGAGTSRLRNEERDAEIQRLRAEGWTQKRLGDAFGLTQTGIQALLWRMRHRINRQENFDLSVRAINGLRFGLLHRESTSLPLQISELEGLSYQDLLDLPNVGRITADEIASMLRCHGVVVEGLPRRLVENSF